jgi:hypothetical protein
MLKKKDKRPLFCFTILSILCIVTYSQEYTIQGKVIDSNNNLLEYSTISLFDNLDSLITGCISDKNGDFNLKSKILINSVKIGFIGLKDTVIHNLNFNDENICDLGKIILYQDNYYLNEVVVTHNTIQKYVNKTVYSIDNKMKEKAVTSLDVLSKIPELYIDDLNYQVQHYQFSDIQILINGVPQTDNKVYKSIDPLSIQKIEVVNSLSPKYNSQNIDALINIITDGNSNEGLKGDITIQFPALLNYSNSDIGLRAGLGNFSIYSNYSLYYRNILKTSLLDYNLFSDSDTINYNMTEKQKKHIEFGHTISFGTDWFLNKNNAINAYAQINYNTVDYNKQNIGFYSSKINEFTSVNSDILEIGNFLQQNYSLFFKHNFSKPEHQFTIDLNYYLFDDNVQTSYNYFYNDFENIRSENIINDKTSFNSLFDYYLPISEKTQVESGFQFYTQNMSNEFSNPEKTYFNYQENRTASYVNFRTEIRDYGIQLGFRLENSNIIIDKRINKNYIKILPNFDITRTLGEKHYLNFNIERSIERPDIWLLNPFEEKIDTLSFRIGNPYLSPKDINEYIFAYTYQTKSFYYKTQFFYSYTNNDFANIRIYKDGKFQTTTDNILRNNQIGIGIVSQFSILNNLTITPVVNLIRQTFETDSTQFYYTYPTPFYGNFKLSIKYHFLENWHVKTYLRYSTNQPIYQGYIKEPFFVSFTTSRKVFNKNGVIELILYQPFIPNNKISYAENIETKSIVHSDSGFRVILLSFNYFFGQRNKVSKIERKYNLDLDY